MSVAWLEVRGSGTLDEARLDRAPAVAATLDAPEGGGRFRLRPRGLGAVRRLRERPHPRLRAGGWRGGRADRLRGPQVTNVCFGGPEHRTLFVTESGLDR